MENLSKTLIRFGVYDNNTIKQCQVNESAPKSIWASKYEAKVIQDKLKSLMNGQKKQISLTNKTEREKFFKAFLATLTFGDTFKNLSVLDQYGMSSDKGFAAVILGNKSAFDENHWNTSCIKNFNDVSSEYQKWSKSKDFVQGKKVEDTNDQGDLDDRILICYDRWCPENAEAFDIIGKRNKQNDYHVNMCRYQFRINNGIKYDDSYAILAHNYFGRLSELKERAAAGLMDTEAYED